MTAVQQFAFPWGIPQDEPKRVRTKWEELKEMATLARGEESGGLLPMNLVPAVLDVSHQRVCQLCDDGRLTVHVFFDRKFIAINSLAEWISSERKSGRPVRVAETPGEVFKRSRAIVAAHQKKKK